MGRWFPDYRTGTPEQCAEFRDAQYDLERKAGPLSRAQQWWHGQRALGAEERDFSRLQTASDRQDRAHREGRTR